MATAQFKTFLDRWHGADRKPVFKDKLIILAIPLEGGNSKAADPLLGMFKYTLDYLRMKFFTTLVATRVLDKGAIRDFPGVLSEARRVGSEVVKAVF